MFNNLKIGARLILTFGLVTLILLMVGGLGIYEANKLNRSILDLLEHRMVALRQANIILDSTNDVSRFMLSMAVTEEATKRAPFEQRLRDQEAVTEQAMAALKKTATDAKTRELLGEGENLWNSYMTVVNQYIGMTKTLSMDEAHRFLVSGPIQQRRAQFVEVFSQVIKRQDALANEGGLKAADEAHRANHLITILLVAGLVTGLGMAVLIVRSITGPVGKAAALAQVMAQGDFTQKLDITQEDEIGQMAASLNTMSATLNPIIKQIVGHSNQLNDSSSALAAISKQIADGARGSAALASSVAEAAEQMNGNIHSVSAVMEQSSGNISMVASSTEEMTVTVNEIARNTERARSISEGAVTQSRAATERMTALGESARKIGRVTETITEISEQTNLLALNATIEAARAGEAGKGFAVVANEIKELARQTAEATVDIRNQIGEMQNTTSTTVMDIEKISEVITEINTVISGIATAVEEQSAASSEIAQNISQTSLGIGEVNENVAQTTVTIAEITQNINKISENMKQAVMGTSQAQESTQAQAGIVQELTRLMRTFKV